MIAAARTVAGRRPAPGLPRALIHAALILFALYSSLLPLYVMVVNSLNRCRKSTPATCVAAASVDDRALGRRGPPPRSASGDGLGRIS